MLVWIIASLLAFFVKGLCGFANTLVFTSVLSLRNDNISISPVELLLGYPTNCIIAFKERKSIRMRICLPISVLVVIGSIPGILLLKNTDTRIVKVIFGFVLVLVAIEMFFRKKSRQEGKEGRILFYLIGFLSGILCGLYGVGALLGAYVARITEDASSFRANICVVFLVENTLRIALYSVFGIINFEVLKLSIMLVPFMFLGLFSGIACTRRLDDRIAGRVVVILLLLSGIFLIMENV